MGSMICCSSLEGKYEEKDIENDSIKHNNEEERTTTIIQQPVLPRCLSQKNISTDNKMSKMSKMSKKKFQFSNF